MDQIKITAALALLACTSMLSAQTRLQEYDFEWSRTAMDGSRTGVRFAKSDSVTQAIGRIEGRNYISPSGRSFRKRTATYKAATLMIDAQKDMSSVKQVVAESSAQMNVTPPECALSDWFIDLLMEECSQMTGCKVDVGFANFGGIRTDMPKGEVLLDDIMSMFPFHNKLCYLRLSGKDIRAILEQMASLGWQVVGGVRCISDSEGNLLSAEIGGNPIYDNKMYGVATIDFLLDGGDGYHIGRNAEDLRILDPYIYDVVLPYVRKLTEEGKPIEYKTDGRIIIKD